MRDRLIELLRNAPKTDTVYGNIKLPEPVQTLQTIADHLLSEGVIVPPVKVGQTVYVLTNDSPIGVEETKISQVVVRCKGNCKIQYSILAPCVYDDWGSAKWSFCENDFGGRFFLTRSEAEKALAERKGDGT